MLYYFLRSFIKTKPIYAAIIVLLIAYLVEFLQLLQILNYLNVEENSVLRIIFGTTFSVTDLIAYTLGIVTVFLIEKN
jgi:ABC-type glucose/galactose transport system permease subunit